MSEDPGRRSGRHTRRRVALLAVIAALVLIAAGSGCCAREVGDALSSENDALVQLQIPASAWWTGSGDYAVLQAVGKDGRPVVVVWDRKTGRTRSYPRYRVVDVEPHAPRFWVVPDSRLVSLSSYGRAKPHVIDIAGDGVDSLPSELYVVRLDENGAKPRSDVDARWAAWDGGASYSVSVEIDVNRGGCPSTLRFYATGGSLNAWPAQVPTDVVSFEPIGWSSSGKYFAVISQADASATADAVAAWTTAWERAVETAAAVSKAAGNKPADIEEPPPPTWGAEILMFSAADGSVVARQQVAVPILEPNAGANLALWSDKDDILFYFGQAGDRPALAALMPRAEVEAKDPFVALAPPSPRFAWFVGLDKEERIVGRIGGRQAADGDIHIWRITGGPLPVEVGTSRGAETARWSAHGGMLSLAGPHEGPKWAVVYVSPTVGGASAEAFSVDGPSEPLQSK